MPLMLVVGTINKYPPPGEGWTVTHVDLSERGIYDPELGRQVPVDVACDMRALPFADGTVERIQSWHALEHVNQQGGRDTIAEFHRVLSVGGILDVCVPDLDYLLSVDSIEPHLSLIYGEQLAMADAELNAHRWGYTPASLERLLAEHGFTAIEPAPLEYPADLHLTARR